MGLQLAAASRNSSVSARTPFCILLSTTTERINYGCRCMERLFRLMNAQSNVDQIIYRTAISRSFHSSQQCDQDLKHVRTLFSTILDATLWELSIHYLQATWVCP